MDATNPATFVGIPDPRSAVLAVLFVLPLFLALCWSKLGSGWLWVAMIVAALLFPFSIAWLQVPLQLTMNSLLGGVLSPAVLQQYLLLAGIPSILLSGLVQEAVKLLIAIVAMSVMWGRQGPRVALAAGAAAGAGYGGFEAFWVFNTIFASGWSWATVDLAGWTALLGFVERLIAVPFHIALAAIAAYGYYRGRGWLAYFLVALTHGLANYGALLLQAKVLDVIGVELWVAVIALITAVLALVFHSRARA